MKVVEPVSANVAARLDQSVLLSVDVCERRTVVRLAGIPENGQAFFRGYCLERFILAGIREVRKTGNPGG